MAFFEKHMQFCVEKCIKPLLYLKKWPRYQGFFIEFQKRLLWFLGQKYGQDLLPGNYRQGYQQCIAEDV